MEKHEGYIKGTGAGARINGESMEESVRYGE